MLKGSCMSITLKAAVGKHIRLKQAMRNRPEDVLKVQTLLRVAHHLRGVPSQLIAADGRIGSETLNALIEFQRDVWQSAQTGPEGRLKTTVSDRCKSSHSNTSSIEPLRPRRAAKWAGHLSRWCVRNTVDLTPRQRKGGLGHV